MLALRHRTSRCNHSAALLPRRSGRQRRAYQGILRNARAQDGRGLQRRAGQRERKEAAALSGKEIFTLSNVKPAVGFTLPSAGVTPAPSIKKDAGLRPC